MKKDVQPPTFTPANRRDDHEKRKIQARRIARIIRVHWLVGQYGKSKDDIDMIAEILKVSKHTIKKDRDVLKVVYEALGTKNLDCPPAKAA